MCDPPDDPQNVATDEHALSPVEHAALVQRGGAFDWLADEPDLYTRDDGEPV